jgi:hypothetical protein
MSFCISNNFILYTLYEANQRRAHHIVHPMGQTLRVKKTKETKEERNTPAYYKLRGKGAALSTAALRALALNFNH